MRFPSGWICAHVPREVVRHRSRVCVRVGVLEDRLAEPSHTYPRRKGERKNLVGEGARRGESGENERSRERKRDPGIEGDGERESETGKGRRRKGIQYNCTHVYRVDGNILERILKYLLVV